MARYYLRRLIVIPLGLFLANFFGFAYAHIARPLRASQNPFLLGNIASEPVLPAYRNYLAGVLQGDWGAMPYGGTRVSILGTIGRVGLNSLGILLPALALSIFLGFILGLRGVRANPPRVSSWLTSISTTGLAMPSFYLGSLFIAGTLSYIVFGPGEDPPLPVGGFGWDSHLVMPILVLTLRPTMQIAQITSALLVDELGKQYVVAARSIGHPWRAIFRRYALRNVLAAVIVGIGGSLRLLVGELIVVERLFEWPGLGALTAQTLVPAQLTGIGGANESLPFLDPTILAAVLTVVAMIFLLTDLITSILVQRVDPRLRLT